jgi:hypothetical protein
MYQKKRLHISIEIISLYIYKLSKINNLEITKNSYAQ